MLSRGLTCALRLRSRALSASVPSNRPLLATSEVPAPFQGLALLQSNTFTTSSVCGIFAAGGSLQQEAPSRRSSSSKNRPSAADSTPKYEFLQDSRSLAAEQALVTRLASVWGMPPEVLASNVAMLAEILKPCGRDTAAHALWVLVRCPALRHMTDQQVRNTVRNLHQQFPDIPKPAFKVTVYKHPWVLEAELPSAHTASPSPVRSSSHNSSSNTSTAPDQQSSPKQQKQQVVVTPWKRELALMLLEMQSPSSTDSSSISHNTSLPRASGTAALAAVRMYLAAAEARHLLSRGFSWAKALSSPKPKPSAVTSSTTPTATASDSTTAAKPTAAGGPIRPSQPSPVAVAFLAAASTSTDRLAGADAPLDRNRQMLQQLLYVCPKLTVLPPDLLAARWQLLQSILLGQADSAAAVVMTNPYLMVSGYGYVDKPQQGGGGSLSDWDYGQLAGLV